MQLLPTSSMTPTMTPMTPSAVASQLRELHVLRSELMEARERALGTTPSIGASASNSSARAIKRMWWRCSSGAQAQVGGGDVTGLARRGRPARGTHAAA
eukprot:jgi/Chrpa1/6216/Chrysochromulina_OHIO_Genome00005047-RA